jgi:Glycosyl transferases group 1
MARLDGPSRLERLAGAWPRIFRASKAETRLAPFHVVWRVSPHFDLTIMSGILSGLATLEKRKRLSLSFEFMSTSENNPEPLMELVVTDREIGEVRNVVIDCYDRADRVSPSALKFSDVYFKRAFGPETRGAACPSNAQKIVPAGLSIACYSREALRHVCMSVLASSSKESSRTRSALAELLHRAYEGARLWLTFPPPQGPVLRDTDVKHLNIVFQPRLWPTTPGSGDQFDVANDDRIATVLALRRAFPHERAIGLVHSEVAAAMAPELLLPEHVRTGKYHAQLRQARIAVSCVGLSGSVGFKFGESMAAGTAIVSQPISHEFLAPIIEGVHYLAYRSPEECVDVCRRLMSDRALVARMHEVNRRYFLDWVDPSAHVAHLLTRAFA